MNSKNKSVLYVAVGIVLGMMLMYFFNTYTAEKKHTQTSSSEIGTSKSSSESSTDWSDNKNSKDDTSGLNIDDLTNERRVISYVKEHHKLPAYYITKNEARNQGWEASKGNLCDVLPGRAIGGDRFSNREKKLPNGDAYFEADVNYACGRRNADRIVFTKKGEVYLTKNHYKTFEKQ